MNCSRLILMGHLLTFSLITDRESERTHSEAIAAGLADSTLVGFVEGIQGNGRTARVEWRASYM